MFLRCLLAKNQYGPSDVLNSCMGTSRCNNDMTWLLKMVGRKIRRATMSETCRAIPPDAGYCFQDALSVRKHGNEVECRQVSDVHWLCRLLCLYTGGTMGMKPNEAGMLQP